MKHYLIIILSFLLCGCVQQTSVTFNSNIDIEEKNVSDSFNNLIEKWNSLSTLKKIETKEGFEIFVDGRLSAVQAPCSDNMMPTFNCSDILIEKDAESLIPGDIVSFVIDSSQASKFREKPFNGSKIIYRRIYRIGNDGEDYYIMKSDSTENTHPAFVRKEEIKSKVIGIIMDSRISNNRITPYEFKSYSISDFNSLVEKWNSFVSEVYMAKIEGGYELYYSKEMTVPSLACTGSMRPVLDCNDLILSYKPKKETELSVGDIISFRIAPNETYGFLEPPTNKTIHVMHRIYRITTSDGRIAFITKGDNPETNKQTDAIYLSMDRIELKAVAYFKNSYNETFKD